MERKHASIDCKLSDIWWNITIGQTERKIDSQSDKEIVYTVKGRIGADITYSGLLGHNVSLHEKDPKMFHSQYVKLYLCDRLLVTMGRTRKHPSQAQGYAETTNSSWLCTPEWDDYCGSCLHNLDENDYFEIYHGANQCPIQVVNNLCDMIAKSKERAAQQAQTGQLEFPFELI